MEENSKQPRIIKLSSPLKDSTEATFFLVVGPGLEAQAEKEVRGLLRGQRIEVTAGGIQFDSTFGVVRRAQPKLRIASRVLIRVDQFGARDFQKLFRKVSNLPWEEWLKPKVGLSVRAASHGSRLRIKAGIEESVVDAFKKSFRAPPPRPTSEVLCLVRVDDDICTVSLDLSGDLLHQRGTHTDVGAAPLRETWAASIVDRAFEIIGHDKELKALFENPWEWVEPMAGTAVFLREALGANAVESDKVSMTESQSQTASPAASETEPPRTFAVDTCFRFEKDDEAELGRESLGSLEKKGRSFSPMPHLKRATIVDSDAKQLERAKKALAALKSKVPIEFLLKSPGEAPLKSSGKVPSKVLVDSGDTLPRLLFVNPPWGQRLKGPEAMDTAANQMKLMSLLEREWTPSCVAIVLPRIAGSPLKLPKGWTEHRSMDFRSGGLPVTARFFTVVRK